MDNSQKMKPVKSISPKKGGKSPSKMGKPKLIKTAKNSDYDNNSSLERDNQVSSAMR